jgi:hypothetical protein
VSGRERSASSRWIDTTRPPGTVEAHAADLVRKIGEPTPLSDERMAAVRSRIVLRRGARRPPRRFTPAFVTVALLVGATLGAAARGWMEPLLGPIRARPGREERPELPAPRPSRKPRVSAVAARLPEPTVAPAIAPASVPSIAPAPAIAPPGPEADPPKGRPRRVPSRETMDPVQASSGDSEETGLLALAIRRLRQGHDARGALAALDERAQKFRDGDLAAEADLVRVEALLALGDRAAALRLLEGTALAARPRARKALTLRGELRAADGRCAEAVADLEPAIGPRADPNLAERALFARASCLARLQRYPEARRDLEAYLLHFPDGPRAAAAREALIGVAGAK